MKRRFEFVSGSSAKFYEVYVSGNRVEIRFGRIGAAGFQPTVDVVASERVRLDAALAHEFGCEKGTEVSRLVRAVIFEATRKKR